jgi:hypothetical protein
MVYGILMDHGNKKTKPILEPRPTPKEREEERVLEFISNPDTIRAKPEPFGGMKAASNVNQNESL